MIGQQVFFVRFNSILALTLNLLEQHDVSQSLQPMMIALNAKKEHKKPTDELLHQPKPPTTNQSLWN